jgi:Transglycosylase-like domain/LysM domain
MFIIPVAGLAKTLVAVTISLQPAAHHAPASYTVRPGDSLSAIAGHAYGSGADWPAVWWANRRQVANPDMIAAGQRLRLPASGQVPAWMARAALAAIPAASPAAAPAVPVSAPQADPSAPVQAAPVPASSGGANWSAIAACESGGNWSASTGNGFYGGLQFTEQTWLAYGGGQYASSANLASQSQQVAVAQRVLAGQGIGAWPVCGAGG